jgi:AAA+ superfamily predicted ATPase
MVGEKMNYLIDMFVAWISCSLGSFFVGYSAKRLEKLTSDLAEKNEHAVGVRNTIVVLSCFIFFIELFIYSSDEGRIIFALFLAGFTTLFFFGKLNPQTEAKEELVELKFFELGTFNLAKYTLSTNEYLGLESKNRQTFLPTIFHGIHKHVIKDNFYYVQLQLDSNESIFCFENKSCYKNTRSFTNELMEVYDENYHGICDLKGNLILPLAFHKIEIEYSNFSYHIFKVTQYTATCLIDSNKNTYSCIRSLNDGNYIAFKKNSKWGVLSNDGKILIENVFDYIEFLSTDQFKVVIAGKQGVLNSKNQTILPIEYNDIKMHVNKDNNIRRCVSKDGLEYELLDAEDKMLKKINQKVYINSNNKLFVFKGLVPTLLESEEEDLTTYYSILKEIVFNKDSLPLEIKLESSASGESHFENFDNTFIGQKKAKEQIEIIFSVAKTNKLRIENKLPTTNLNLNAAFVGNPGTGKTTFARIYAEKIKEIGLLKRGHLVEVKSADLIAGYQGQTAMKTEEKFREAIGGILFIDEAYAIKSSKDNSYGQECIDTLNKLMSDYSGEIIVIIAGYDDKIKDFLQENDGLKSRIPNMVNFEDYTSDELKQMLRNKFLNKMKMNVSEDLLTFGTEQILQLNRGRNFANGREVDNLYGRVYQQYSVRISKMLEKDRTIQNLNSVIYSDFTPDLEIDSTEAPSASPILHFTNSFKELVGLKSVKEELNNFQNLLEVLKIRNISLDDSDIGLNFLFKGNPGTGKTTVARVLGEILKTMGFLANGDVVEVDRGNLVAGFAGQTAIKTREFLDRSLGGVFFLDEAYGLVKSESDQYGMESLETILKFMDDNKGKMAVVFAGYPNEIDQLISKNPGLKSRFAHTLFFEDLTLQEMKMVFLKSLSKKGCKINDSAWKLFEKYLISLKETDKHFGNARTIGKLVVKISLIQSSRVKPLKDSISVEEYNTVIEEDILKLKA